MKLVKQDISPNYSKLKLAPSQKLEKNQNVLAVIKVKQANYVPKGMSLRSRISQNLFTVETSYSQLEILEKDALVTSIELSQNLRSQNLQ